MGALQVVSLEVLHGKPHVVPLLEYGVTSNISGTRQWVLVFPRYASSMREWRTKWAGKGLNTQDLSVYLSLFLQVSHSGVDFWVQACWAGKQQLRQPASTTISSTRLRVVVFPGHQLGRQRSDTQDLPAALQCTSACSCRHAVVVVGRLLACWQEGSSRSGLYTDNRSKQLCSRSKKVSVSL